MIPMAMISASDFRNGVTFEMDGKVMQVVEFQHVKPGKGAAFVRTKMKNIITGGVTETSFNPTAKFEHTKINELHIKITVLEISRTVDINIMVGPPGFEPGTDRL